MEQECRFCGKVIKYDKPQQFGGHLTNCKMNPKRKQILKKRGDANKHERKEFEFICSKCGEEYTLEITQNNFDKGKYSKFCSRSCANSHKRTEESKRKTSKTMLAKNNKRKPKVKCCKICGTIQGQCKQPNICKEWRIFPSLIKYYRFDEKALGTIKVYKEYNRIKQELYQYYWIDKLSMAEIIEKYDYKKASLGSFSNILDKLKIKKRSHSDCIRNAIAIGRLTPQVYQNQYKSVWHTTWDNKQVYLRSSYELDYAQILDKHQVEYEVESLRISYWDSQKKCQRTALPDFYLLESNTIVEIKSNYTYDEQNMKDKFIEYRKLGYKCKLILDKKEVAII